MRDLVKPSPASRYVFESVSSITMKPFTLLILGLATAVPQPYKRDDAGEQQAALEVHNDARAEVGHGLLELDADLSADCAAYAAQLAPTGNCLTHSDGHYGENLFGGKGGDFTLADGATMWYHEKPQYNGEGISMAHLESYGHYTAMVWPSSTKMGIGMGKGPDGTICVVARYTPQGNICEWRLLIWVVASSADCV